MRNWPLTARSAFEKSGPIPRSISKTLEKLLKELDASAENEVMEEWRVARYQTVASLKYLLLLITIPVLVNQISKSWIFGPMVDHLWTVNHADIFLNTSQEERAFAQLQRFEERLHFDILIGKSPNLSEEAIQQQIKNKALEIAYQYAQESAYAVKNVLADSASVAAFLALIRLGKRQLSVFQSFINELIYGLSDTAKAFLIILFTDMFIGFHSPHGWEVLMEALLRHFGLPENRDFIFLFIATFPVALDTVFKYWIFRYLNRVSPSAVATYHNMNE
nr:chloroplast envelope membrane protein [Cyanidioschyzonaceae sp. 3]WDB00447.1 envelope membrane protein [Cyanidiococcus yangmingshanensis]